MSPRAWQGHIQDILQAVAEVLQFIAGMSFDTFCADQRTVRAVAFDVAAIGEASVHVPADLKARHPQIPWTKMRGMRNVIVHDYFGIDLRVLWEMAEQDLPALEVALRQLLEQEAQREAGQ